MIIIENDHLAPSLDDSTSIYILEIFRLVVQTRVNRNKSEHIFSLLLLLFFVICVLFCNL